VFFFSFDACAANTQHIAALLHSNANQSNC
jgi:hypothetical protein